MCKNKLYRQNFEPILWTTSLHFLSLYFTMSNFYYSSIVILSTSSSIIWHREYECSYNQYVLDYFFATLLTMFEIHNGNDKTFIIYANLFVFIVNKATDVLSSHKILKYTTAHSFFHIISSIKTIYISYKFSK